MAEPMSRFLPLVTVLAEALLSVHALCEDCRAQPGPVRFYGDQYRFPGPILLRPRAADLDADGFLDVIETRRGDGPNVGPVIHWNQGNGIFDRGALPMPPGLDPYIAPALEPALADVDRDGDIDILAPQSFPTYFGRYPPYLFLNDGNRRFHVDTRPILPRETMGSRGANLVDFDGDGDVDVLFWGDSTLAGRTDRLFLNDGTGMFAEVTATHLPSVLANTEYVTTADVDGDGDTDLVWGPGSTSASALIMKNDGRARFSISQTLGFGLVRHIVSGDVTGDGYPDLFLARGGAPDRLLVNDRTGSFLDESWRLPFTTVADTMGAHIADLDYDTDLDLVLSSQQSMSFPAGPQVWLNDGTGRFSGVTVSVFQSGNETQWFHVFTGDFDRDGDLDFGGTLVWEDPHQFPRGGARIVTGMTRHVYVPAAVLRNATFDLVLDARSNHLVVPFLGAPAPLIWIPPIGHWALDPLLRIQLQSVFFPDASARKLRVPVPNDPALSGQTLRVQAADAWYEGQVLNVRTTNWLAFRIL